MRFSWRFCEFSLPVLKLFLVLIFVKKILSKKTWICDKYCCFFVWRNPPLAFLFCFLAYILSTNPWDRRNIWIATIAGSRQLLSQSKPKGLIFQGVWSGGLPDWWTVGDRCIFCQWRRKIPSKPSKRWAKSSMEPHLLDEVAVSKEIVTSPSIKSLLCVCVNWSLKGKNPIF